jgi:DNA (cytosine-5)-methyltransferase 1
VPAPTIPRVPFTFADLFAGIGGFHAALTALGGRAVLASEIDPKPAAVYERNWGLRPAGDITVLADDPLGRIPEHHVLAGGFPCQPFSKSGAQRGMSELRGRMVHEVLRILEVRKPPVLLLENVRNIAGPRQREVWQAVVGGLREAGYRVPDAPCVFSPHLLPPHLGGSPQIRDRVYILGTYVGRERALREVDVAPVVARRPVDGWDPQKWDLERDLLQHEHEVADRGAYLLDDDEQEWIEVWNDFLRRTRRVQLPGHPLWSALWHDDAAVDDTAPSWKQAIEAANLRFYRANRRAIEAWLRANPGLRSFPASRQKLEWQAQDHVRDLRACLLHMRPSGIRAKKPTYAPALVAMAQTPVVGPRLRRMTLTEAARLQGFPEDFDFGDQRRSLSYKQLGNAVHVGAAFHVLREHVRRDAEAITAAGAGVVVEAVEGSPLSPADFAWSRSPASH